MKPKPSVFRSLIYFAQTIVLAVVASHLEAKALQRKTFEVASIKRAEPDVKAARILKTNPEGIQFSNVTALDCILAAFGIHEYEVSGPGMIKADRYVIAARAPSPSSDEEIRGMLQSLLEERFKLEYHRETKTLDVYAMSQAREVRLKPAEGVEARLGFNANTLEFHNYSMMELAAFLSSLPGVDRPIQDATGLDGRFDFELVVDAPATDPGAVKRAMLAWDSMFTDLNRQVGLKIEARKLPSSMLVVDRIEKPTPN